jgi:hypothetical protein
MRSILTILAAGVFLSGVVVEGVAAQSAGPNQAGQNTSDPDLQAQIDATFKQVLADPGNVDLAYKYAGLLIKAGSYEPAAGVLERILVVDSKQPVVRLELGVLYYRLGSYALAQTYIQEALEDSELTQQERARGQQYLAAIEQRSSLNQVAGSVSTGIRWQSDANLASTNGQVETFGVLVPRDQVPVFIPTPPFVTDVNAGPKREFNPFVYGQVQDSYDLQTQNEAAIISTLGFYGTRQIGDKTLSTSAFEGTVGPSFKPLRITLPDLRVRFYGIFGAAYLDDQFFSDAAGPGVSASYQFSERFAVDGAYEYRYEHFHSVGTFANAVFLKGDYNLFRLRGAYQISPTQTLSLEAVLNRNISADAAAYTNRTVQINAVYRLQYGSPIPEELPAPWNVSFLFGHAFTTYHAPDPTVTGFVAPVTRADPLYSIGAMNREPLLGTWEAFQQVQYDHDASNIPNYQYSNLTLIAGVTWSF